MSLLNRRNGDTGIVLERRAVLQLSVGALCAFPFVSDIAFALAAAEARDPSRLNSLTEWNEFVQRISAMARRLVVDATPDEEEYLMNVGGLLTNLVGVPVVTFDQASDVQFAQTYESPCVLITLLNFAPYAAIPHHDHAHFNGALRVVSGEIRVRSYELVRETHESTKGSTVMLLQTKEEALAAGDLSTLSRTRDNIHDIRAGRRGARLIDVFTLFRPGARSRTLMVLSREPVRDVKQRKLSEAAWIE